MWPDICYKRKPKPTRMKPLHGSILLLFFIFPGCSDDSPEPVPLVEKKIRFEIYSDTDYSGEVYANHYVQIRVGVLLTTYDPHKEEHIFDETTDWIALKDLPTIDNRIVFETTASNVNVDNQSVMAGYSYVLKIGDYTEMYSGSSFVQNRETQKTIPIRF